LVRSNALSPALQACAHCDYWNLASCSRPRGPVMNMLRQLLLLALAGLAAPAAAELFPNRPVHLVVAYAPGGTGDIVARLISDRLAASLGQSVVVENRPGASGAIGTQSVVAAAPDGHTLLVGQTAEIVINQHWIKSLGYDAERDLQPVAL